MIDNKDIYNEVSNIISCYSNKETILDTVFSVVIPSMESLIFANKNNTDLKIQMAIIWASYPLYEYENALNILKAINGDKRVYLIRSYIEDGGKCELVYPAMTESDIVNHDFTSIEKSILYNYLSNNNRLQHLAIEQQLSLENTIYFLTKSFNSYEYNTSTICQLMKFIKEGTIISIDRNKLKECFFKSIELSKKWSDDRMKRTGLSSIYYDDFVNNLCFGLGSNTKMIDEYWLKFFE